jgi:hypothetical protein
MKRLSKEKKNQLALVGIVTAIVMAGLWFGLINVQQNKAAKISRDCEAAEQKLTLVRKSIQDSEQLAAQVAEVAAKLGKLEAGMATGDLYSWAINSLRQFKTPYKVEIPQFSQIDGPKDTTMLAGFPYQQATLTIGGTAYFYDFGRFLADFENAFPYIRVQNLQLEPMSAMASNDAEKLTFRMDIITLVKPEA